MNNPKPNTLYRADSIATSLGISAVATTLSRLIGLLRGVALAWLIPQAQFGLFGVALLIVNVLLPICSAGLYEGVTRYAPAHESAGTLRRFVPRSLLIVLGIASATTVTLAWFATPLAAVMFSSASLSPDPRGAADPAALVALARITLVCVLALAAYQTLVGLLKGLRMFRALAATELTNAFLFTILAVIGALGGQDTARALIGAYAISCVACVALFSWGLIAKLTRAGAPSGIRQPAEPDRASSRLMTFSLWAAGTAVLWHALSYYPMWYLLKVSDRETVGTFHAVRLITQFIQVGAVMLTAIVSVNVTRTWEHQGRSAAIPQLILLTKASMLILIAAATVLTLLRPVVMHLFPITFAAGSVAYCPLVLFFLLVGLVGLIAVRLNLIEKPRLVCLAWLIGAVVNVASSYLMLGSGAELAEGSASALQSAAWAGVIGAVAALITCMILTWREGLILSRSEILLIVAAFAVGGGWVVALSVSIALAGLVVGTPIIFSANQRSTLWATLSRTTPGSQKNLDNEL